MPKWPGRKHLKRFRRRKSIAATTVSSYDEEEESLLLALPPELRMEIYEHVFAIDDTKTIDILSARPPAPDLLLTNRQINTEARPAYDDGVQAFWRLSRFSVDYHRWYLVGTLRPQEVMRIRELKLLVSLEQLEQLSADGFTLRTKTMMYKYLSVPKDRPISRYRTGDGRWVCTAERPEGEGLERITLVVTAA
jgi:hypothetical protein